jgi:hypothetical protein
LSYWLRTHRGLSFSFDTLVRCGEQRSLPASVSAATTFVATSATIAQHLLREQHDGGRTGCAVKLVWRVRTHAR